MYKQVVTIALLVLLSAAIVWAGNGKEFNQTQALTACPTCVYEFSDTTVAFGNYSWGIALSNHTFSFSAPDKAVSNIEMTVFVPTTSARIYSQTILFTDYISLTHDTLATDSGVWFYYQWIRTNDFDTLDTPTEMLNLTLWTADCFAPTAGIPLQIKDNDAAGFQNTFVEETEGTMTPTLSDGHVYFLDPLVDLTAWPTDATQDEVVDSAVAGGQVAVPLYLRDVTFEYRTFDFIVGYDTANLDFDHWESNYTYSWQSHASEQSDGIHIGSSNSYAFPTPAEDVVLGVLYFNIEADATVGGESEVWIDGDAHFASFCSYYADTSNTETESALVKVIEDAAVWKIQKRSVCNSSTPGELVLDFYVLTNQYIKTDAGTDLIKARFAFDQTNIGNMQFVRVNDVPYNGGTMHWQAPLDGDIRKIQEDPDELSPAIVPSTSYQKVGELVFYVDDIDGTNNVIIETDASLTNMTTKFTNQVLTVANGNLDIENGYLLVKYCPPPHGCPAVFSWNGDDFIMEDFVLTHSQKQAMPHADDDYLPLKSQLVPVDGQYHIQIREFENEKTYLDQVELIAADYPVGSSIGISEDGRILTHQKWLEPINAIDQDGNDVLGYIGAEDGVKYVDEGEGSLKLTFTNPFAGKGTAKLGFLATGEDKPIEPPIWQLSDQGPDWSGVTAEIEDAGGNWHYLGNSVVRENGAEGANWVFEDPSVSFGSEISIRLSWVDGFEADVQRLLVDDGAAVTTHHLSPSVAEHSALGKAIAGLVQTDREIITLEPGETIDLRFVAPEAPEAGMVRAFFLKTHGYYEASGAGNLPTDYALNQNYPNPFNPTTTISFALPKTSEVRLAVYNLLGQEINTLISGSMEAGTHEIVWEGTDRDGNSVASGVYFYRLTAGDYTASKKMTLVK